MKSLLGLTPEEIQELIQAKERFRSRQIYHALYTGIESFDAITDLPLSLRQQLSENFSIFTSKIDTSLDDEDGNCKLRIELSDGLFTECMILSDGTDRKTICISSQVGCKMGCAFCRTADMGFRRNLTSGEILEQFLIGQKLAGKLSNIVFMGMGEPFDNIENLLKAVSILNDRNAVGLGARRMTISTCGVVPGIQMLAKSPLEIRLAVSLNSAIEEKRREIMPITARYPLAELKTALKEFQKDKNKRFTFEYVLIKDFNMGDEDIKALRHFTSGLSVLVNLIPWNTVEGKPFQTPDRKDINIFCSKLDKMGINYTLRKRKGFGVSGACGQLAYKAKKN